MYPILFRLWNFPINTYGVFLALAFLAAIFVTVRLAERDGLPREKIYDLCLWLLISSLVGSKLLMFFTEPEYRQHPLQLFSLDFLRSGGVFYGGLIGAIVTGYLLMRRWKLPWWKTADACAPGIALGNVLGRQGCFSAGCCWGKPTTLPWGVPAPGVDYLVHPTPLYDAAFNLIWFGILMLLRDRPALQDGNLLKLGLAGYLVFRFCVEFVRNNRVIALGLTGPQFFCLALLAALGLYFARHIQANRRAIAV